MLNELSSAILLRLYNAAQKPQETLSDLSVFDFGRDIKSYALEVADLKKSNLIKGALVQDGPYGSGPIWANLDTAYVTDRGVDVLKELMLIK